MSEHKGKFLKIVCPKCKQKQITFGKSSMQIKCKRCNNLLTKPSGGKTKIKAIVKEVIWN